VAANPHAHRAGSTPVQNNQPRKKLHLMNKAELVESVQKALGKETSKAQAERAVEAVIDSIKGGLKKGKPVQLVGFGTFKVASRKARMGINPKTGAKIKIKASKSVKFGAGKDLKSKL
jgi:nucleoid DNA-binding protein